MTALHPGHPALAARLSESLAALLVEHSAREVGRWLNLKGDTISARGRAVRAWDLPDLMAIGARFTPVRDALREYINGSEIRAGESTAAVGDLLRDVTASAAFIASAARALGDGRVSDTEASDLLIEIARRRELEDLSLIPALTACVREG